jgi:peptidoglycan/LPS O-acetylase OafA/YrhL
MKSLVNVFRIDFDRNRVYGLDILRALAVLFVVLGHGSKLLFPTINKVIYYLLFDGVAIFFVLSGFLIGGILIKVLEKEKASHKALFNFWIRRWFRTVPNYFLVLFILMLLSYLFNGGFTFSAGYEYFLFAQNLFTPHPIWFPEAWSLSVEEWFYLLIPIIVFSLVGMCKVVTSKAVLWTSILILILMTSIRIYRYIQTPVDNFDDWDLVFRRQVLTRLDSLMFGVIGAYIYFYHKKAWLKYKNSLFILGVFLFLLIKYMERYNINGLGLYTCVFSFSLTSFATLILLPFLTELKSGNGMVYKLMTYISLISYSMYLLHFSVIQKWIIVNMDFTQLPVYVGIATKYLLYWIITILSSILLFKYFETPVMKLRERF